LTKIKFERQCVKGSVWTISTVSFIEPKSGFVLHVGSGGSRCRKGDTFSREIGERKALARAISSLSREERLPIWAQYEFRRVASRTKPKVVDGSHDDGPHEHHDDDRDGERRLPAPGEGPVPLEEML